MRWVKEVEMPTSAGRSEDVAVNLLGVNTPYFEMRDAKDRFLTKEEDHPKIRISRKGANPAELKLNWMTDSLAEDGSLS